MKYPYVIAEAGSCHEGQLERALSLVYTAKHCDADAVKFQFWSSPERMAERRKTDWQAYTRGSIEVEWLPVLSDKAHQVGLEFMCTAYLPEDVAVVEPHVDMFKVSSFENEDLAFIRLHKGKPVIISLGMNGLNWPDKVNVDGHYLHCVSGYPCPIGEAALGKVEMYDGYSDHTRCVLTGAVAVGAGARILEVHFRLDDTTPGCPDYVVALTPQELHQYIFNVRLAGRMMSSTKEVQDCERPNMKHRVGV